MDTDKEQRTRINIRHMFPTSFLDKDNIRMREGDYISLTATETMSNHYWNGLETTNRDPYEEWETEGTVIYLIEWSADILNAEKIKEIGDPHPSFSSSCSIYLNKAFKSTKYKIEGNKHEGYELSK